MKRLPKFTILTRSVLILVLSTAILAVSVFAWIADRSLFPNLGLDPTTFDGALLTVSPYDLTKSGWAEESDGTVTASLGTITNFNDLDNISIYFQIQINVTQNNGYNYFYLVYLDNITVTCLKNGVDTGYLTDGIYYSTDNYGFEYAYLISDTAITDPKSTDLVFSEPKLIDKQDFFINSTSPDEEEEEGEEVIDGIAGTSYLYIKLIPNDNIINMLGHIPISEMPYVVSFGFDFRGEARTL